MASKLELANLFELSGDDIQISYLSSSFEGSPLLSYRDGRINRQFGGESIRCVKTELGESFTVTLEEIPDLRTVTFTLILPVVMALPASAGIHIRVPGITTTIRTTIAGPVLGPEKTYSLVTLKGTAQVVFF